MKNKRKIFSKISVMFFTTSMLLFFFINVFTLNAAAVKINGTEFEAGDVLTYTVKISGAETKIAGINLEINYNKDSLTLKEDTISIPYTPSPICNSEIAGEIDIVWIDGVNGADFKDEHVFISASFEVKENAKPADITFKMIQIVDFDAEEMTTADYKIEDSIQKGLSAESVVAPNDGLDILDSKIEADKKETGFNNSIQYIVIGGFVVIVAALIVTVVVTNAKKRENNE
ncbi:hypothetical protein AGMMS50284_5690 [Clostridia bacterium]|nr:hypothetical protein AGMMS50284_5690 [Clostridia bacterium]